MTDQALPYLVALKKAKWISINALEVDSKISLPWLLEKGSMSRRLEKACDQLRVKLLCNEKVAAKATCKAETKGIAGDSYLLREVVLLGDEEPWIYARTLIPEHSLLELPYDLNQLGEIPLGLKVFSNSNVARDNIEAAWIPTPDGELIARRSRIWIQGKPILVAELFLPNSPIYLQHDSIQTQLKG